MKALRSALVFAALIVACSSNDDDEDKGCTDIGKTPCSTDADCAGFTGGGFNLFGSPDPRCTVAKCEASYCKATYPTGPISDDIDGDCQKASCDGSGHVTYTRDPSDTGSTIAIGQCEVKRCNPTEFFGSYGTSVVPADDGTLCTRSDGSDGVCRSGQCQLDVPLLPSDAGKDGSTDSGADAGDAGNGGEDAAADGG